MITPWLEKMAAARLAAVGLTLIACLSGCGRGEVKQVEALKAEEVPQKIEEAFATAPAEARQAATALATSIQSQPADAFFGLQALGYRPDLSPEQRQAAAQAMLAAREKLEAAAAAGDATARQALEQQAARK